MAYFHGEVKGHMPLGKKGNHQAPKMIGEHLLKVVAVDFSRGVLRVDRRPEVVLNKKSNTGGADNSQKKIGAVGDDL